ncbi:MAG: hypothetical protein JNL73_21295, partial [Anaerolineales bacterium]|nr:hypothetical protein [Anaerolineales bacterium]
SVDDLWRGTQNYGWYRPAIFTLYKLLFAAPPALIGLARAGVWLAHAVSCGLLGGIAARYWRTLNPQSPSSQAMIAAWTATGLGVVFPFAVLPLPHLGTAMHVFTGLGLVVCTAALLRALEERDRSALAVACVSALLSPYFHESGVMVGAAATLAGVIWLGSRWWTRWRPLAAPTLCGLLFLPIWLMSRRSPVGQQIVSSNFDLSELGARVGYFLQPATYPLQFLGGRLHYGLGVFEDTALWISVAAACGLWLWVWGPRRAARLAALAAGAGLLVGLPSITSLTIGYIIISQRLLFAPGLLSIVLWSHLVTRLLRADGQPWRAALVRGGLALWLGVLPLVYVGREVHLHTQALGPLAETIAAVQADPTARHLVVNPITWLTYRERPFPLGHDGVVVGADYVTQAQLIEANTQQAIAIDGVAFADLLPNLSDRYLAVANPATPQWDAVRLVQALPDYDSVWLVQWPTPARNRLVYAGRVQARAADPPTSYLARFEPGLYLTDVQTEHTGGTFTIRLSWSLLGSPPVGEIFRHVYTCDGHLAANGTGAALEGLAPLWGLAAPVALIDQRTVTLSTNDAAGCYRVEVGLFNPADGVRSTPFDNNGAAWSNDVVSTGPAGP